MIFEMIDLSDWKTKKQILKELKSNGVFLNERIFRKTVENYNKLYFEHQVDFYMCHSHKGYKLTNNEDEIRATAKDFRKRGIDQIVKASKTLKALNENANFRLEIIDGELRYSEV